MINAFGCEGQNLHRLTDTSVTALSGAIWIDLLDATQDEISQVKQATGMSIPTLAEVSEIETPAGSRAGTVHSISQCRWSGYRTKAQLACPPASS